MQGNTVTFTDKETKEHKEKNNTVTETGNESSQRGMVCLKAL
jgi:hypothetical protein